MKRIIFITFLLITTLTASAQLNRQAYIWENSKALSAVSVNDTLALFSNLFSSVPQANMSWKKNYCFDNVQGIAKLSIRELTTCLPDTFSCTVKLEVKYWTSSNTLERDTVVLAVGYDKRTGKQYKEQNGSIFTDAHYIGAKVLSISNAAAKPYLNLALQLHSERYTCLGQFTTDTKPLIEVAELINTSRDLRIRFSTSTANELLLDQADEFDVEWTVIDLYDPERFNNLTNTFYYDFNRNATRVSIGRNERSFTIKNVFEANLVLFRYRTVAYYDDNGTIRRVTGPWSSQATVSSGSTVVDPGKDPDSGSFQIPGSITGTAAIDERNSFIKILNSSPSDNIEHLAGQNWQYSAVYAEEAKRRETITYFDGSLRSRQTLTTNNSDSTVLVQENVYDFNGRPAIQVLPVPIVSGAFSYYRKFNRNDSGNAYSAYNFDPDISACQTAVGTMKTDSGASKYYSAQNAFITSKQFPSTKFVPVANGYPFTQTEFMPDNTGRLVARSGVGSKHQITPTGKPTYYLYETPFQEELNRLFGTEVGWNVHYKKTMTIDANGQPGVAYTDLKGRTIATALAANPQNGLDTLISSVPRNLVEASLISGYDASIDKSELTLSKRVNVAEASNYKFKYSFTPQDYFPPACPGYTPCYDCIYDLEISIREIFCGAEQMDGNVSAGSKLVLRRTIGGDPDAVDAVNNGPTSYSFVSDANVGAKDTAGYITISLGKGSYDIVKKLSINKKAYESYEKLFLSNNICKTQDAFEAEAYSKLDTTGCELTCEECRTKFNTTTRAAFITAKTAQYLALGDTLTPAQQEDWGKYYDASKKRCTQICGEKSICETYLDILKLDVSPGGQYAAFTYDSLGNVLLPQPGDPGYISFNVLRASTDPASGSYKLLDPSVKVSVNGTLVSVKDLDVKQFVAYWQEEWADLLVNSHPEYCEYQWCTTHQAVYDYEQGLVEADTYEEGEQYLYASFYFTNDPFQAEFSAQAPVLDAMVNTLYKSFTFSDKVRDLKLHEVALAQVFCTDQGFTTSTAFNNCLSAAIANFNQCGPYKDLFWNLLRSMYLTERKTLIEQAKSTECIVTIPEGGQRRIISTDPVWTSEGGEPTEASVRAGITASCATQCESYKEVWAENLKSCNLDSVQMVEILDQLKGVCVLGCDEYYPVGASSVSPVNDPIAVYRSFDSVIKNYPATSASFIGHTNIYKPSVCSGVLIKFPQPYGHDYFAKSSPYADTCACADSIPPEGCPCNNTGTMKTSNKLVKLIRTDIPDSAKCNDCIDCIKFAKVLKTFTVTHSDLTEDSVQYFDIFQNYFNQQLGFNLSYNDYLEFASRCNRDTIVRATSLQQFRSRYLIVSAPVQRFSLPARELPVAADAEIRFAAVPSVDQTAVWHSSDPFNPAAQEQSLLLAVNQNGYRGGMSAAHFPGSSSAGLLDGIEAALAMAKITASTPVPVDECVCTRILRLKYDFIQFAPGGTFSAYVLTQTGVSVSGPDLDKIESRCNSMFRTGTGAGWSPGAAWNAIAALNLAYNMEEDPIYIDCSLSCSPATCLPSVPNPGGSTAGSTGTVVGNAVVMQEMSCDNFNSVLQGFYQAYSSFISNTPSLKNQLMQPGNAWLLDTLVSRLNAGAAVLFPPPAQPVLFNRANIWAKFDQCKNLCGEFTPVVSQFISDYSLTVSKNNMLVRQLFDPANVSLKNTLLSRLNATVKHSPYWENFDSAVLVQYLNTCNPLECDRFRLLRDSFRTEYQVELSASEQTFRDQMLAPFRRNLFDTLLSWLNNVAATAPYHKQYDSLYLAKLINTCATCADYCVARKDVFFPSFLNELLSVHPLPQPYTPRTNRMVSSGWNVQSTQSSFILQSLYSFAYASDLKYNIQFLSRDKLAARIENGYDKAFNFWLRAVIDPGDKTFSFSRVTSLTLVNVIKEDSCAQIEHQYLATYTYQGISRTVTVYAGGDAFPFFEKKDCSVPSLHIYLCNKPIQQFKVTVDEDPCIKRLKIIARFNAQQYYKEYVDSLRNVFRTGYLKKCMNDSVNELFRMRYNERQYHYTLYYYDQAGNLVKTISPAGVQPLNAAQAALIDGKRTTVQVQAVVHAKAVLYTYNTLNQLVWQQTPDAGRSDFYYDAVGRLVASRNAKQRPSYGYSYTLYDGLGRITQVGEITKTVNDTLSVETARSITGLAAWMSTGVRRQITRTYYDGQLLTVPVAQQNLRGRVASSTFQQADNSDLNRYEYASHYSYDVQGNVKTLVREIKSLSSIGQDLKQVDYEYDIISGKVNKVIYQQDEADQFIHRYTYDQDNRITAVYTGNSRHTLELDAEYWYYLHGPLARVELGAHSVQGVDYAYTINGWLKGVNSETLAANRDMGKDGWNGSLTNVNRNTARDAYGFVLQYYDGDYTPAQVPATTDDFISTRSGSGLQNNTSNLYNGNISMMITAIGKLMETNLRPLAASYRYDQLNRIVSANYYSNVSTSTNAWQAETAMNAWHNRFTYDADGNIISQVRRADNTGGVGFAMDSLDYEYYPNTNQLRRVKDGVPAGRYPDDIDDQTAFTNNYVYDPIGNLTKDAAEEIDSIIWNVYGKITRIKRVAASMKPDLEFAYSPDGHRIMKLVISKQVGVMSRYTYYMRDAQGNIMATYDRSFTKVIDYDSLKYAAVNDSLIKYRNIFEFSQFISSMHGGAAPDQALNDTIKNYLLSDLSRANEFLRSLDPLGPLADGTINYEQLIRAYPAAHLVQSLLDNMPMDELWSTICQCMRSRNEYNAEYPSFMGWITRDPGFLMFFLTYLEHTDPGNYITICNTLGYSGNPVAMNDVVAFITTTEDRDLVLNTFSENNYGDCSGQIFSLLQSMAAADYNATVDLLAAIPEIKGMLTGVDVEPVAQCHPYGRQKVITYLVAAAPEWVWDVVLAGNTYQPTLISWYQLNNPDDCMWYIASQHTSMFTGYQQRHNLYSSSGNGMEAYFGRMKYFGQSFYNDMLIRFYNVSRAYIDSVNVKESMIYGSSRVGAQVSGIGLVNVKFYADVAGGGFVNRSDIRLNEPVSDPYSFVSWRGQKRYELTNHLGNVLAVISDKKIFACRPVAPYTDSNYYAAEVLSAGDYSPFGAPLPGRTYDYVKESGRTVLFNNTFDSGTDGWLPRYVHTTVSQVGGRLKITGTTTWATAQKTIAVKKDKYYILRFTLDMTACNGYVSLPVYNNAGTGFIPGQVSTNTSGNYEYRFRAQDDNSWLLIELTPSNTPGSVLYVDNISLEEDKALDNAARFGFNGKEVDNEVSGSGNSYDYGDRIYSPRLGRWFSVDGRAKDYVPYSPYNFALNNPICLKDADGNVVVDANGNPVTVSVTQATNGTATASFQFAPGTSQEVIDNFNQNGGAIIQDMVITKMGQEQVQHLVTTKTMVTMEISEDIAVTNYEGKNYVLYGVSGPAKGSGMIEDNDGGQVYEKATLTVFKGSLKYGQGDKSALTQGKITMIDLVKGTTKKVDKIKGTIEPSQNPDKLYKSEFQLNNLGGVHETEHLKSSNIKTKNAGGDAEEVPYQKESESRKDPNFKN